MDFLCDGKKCEDVCKYAPPENKWPCVDCDMRCHDRAEPKTTNKEWLFTLNERKAAEIIIALSKVYLPRFVGNRLEILTDWLKQEHNENSVWWNEPILDEKGNNDALSKLEDNMSEQTANPYIRFYIPSDELIPTDLRLMVGSVKVRYEKIFHGFKFEVYESDTEKAKGIMDEIVRQMLIDHDETEHGVSWRTVSLEEVQSAWGGCHVYEWCYRVRDSY